MSCISVVRLGPTEDNVSAGMLRNAVLDFFAKKQQGTAPAAITSNDSFVVTNKYFDAKILLREISNDTNNNKNNEDDDCSTGFDCPLKEDGIILVFDAAKSNPDLVVDRGGVAAASSFGSLGMVHDKAVEVGGGDLLRLCVGVTIGSMEAFELRGRQAYEKEYARRIHWCLDRGYEYVECDLSREGVEKGHAERDKEGFARVVEAIGGTMWSSAVMNKSKKTALKKSYEEETTAMDPPQGQPPQEQNEYIPPDPSMLLGGTDDNNDNDDKAREERARQALLEQSGIAQETEMHLDDGSSTPATATTTTGQENVNPDGRTQQQQREREQERIFDNMESALRQAASIREMSRTADLSDDDRRKRAGDAAELLMTLMQQIGMDDDSDEDEGEEVEEEPVESN